MEVIKKLYKVIQDSLAKTRFKNVPILSPDFNEPIQRPSIKVLISNDTAYRHGPYHFNYKKSVKIHFFGTDLNNIRAENMEVSQILTNGILTSGISDTVTSIQNDGVLILECDIETNEIYEEYSLPEAPGEEPPDYEFMENIDINLGGDK